MHQEFAMTTVDNRAELEQVEGGFGFPNLCSPVPILSGVPLIKCSWSPCRVFPIICRWLFM